MSRLSLVVLICSFFGGGFMPVLAQQNSAPEQLQLHDAPEGLDLPVYRGKAYHGYPPSYESSPHIPQQAFSIGWVQYRGVVYRDVLLSYDAHLQKLIVSHPHLMYPVQLEMEWTQAFEVGGYYFERVNFPDHEVHGALELVLDSGNLKLWAEYKMQLRKQARAGALRHWFYPQNRYYIQHDGETYLADGRKSLYRAFPQYKKELRRFYKSQDLNFRNNPRESLLEMLLHLQKLMVRS